MRRMRKIRSVSGEDNALVAEAGVILSDVHDAAEAADRFFPLSLEAKGSATVGGLVSTNGGGVQVLRYGTMRALTTGMEAESGRAHVRTPLHNAHLVCRVCVAKHKKAMIDNQTLLN